LFLTWKKWKKRDTSTTQATIVTHAANTGYHSEVKGIFFLKVSMLHYVRHPLSSINNFIFMYFFYFLFLAQMKRDFIARGEKQNKTQPSHIHLNVSITNLLYSMMSIINIRRLNWVLGGNEYIYYSTKFDFLFMWLY